MGIAFTYFSYSVLFIITYFQVFLLLTIFDHKDSPDIEGDLSPTLMARPTITVLVPVFNEEKTVVKTVESLLSLNYQKEKLNIMIVDDGSTDNTWSIVQQFASHPHIKLHQKKNGGKYTALNYGIEHCNSEFIGCLDADSFVDPEALNYILPYFDDQKTMAVTPSMKIQNPDSILGLMQNAEYSMGIFTRKMFSLLDAQYVTPGPFSIFRKDVFKKVGLYRHAHNTEDLEMALRLQEQHYKITNAHKAVVYTAGPRTLYKLYRQRVRWTGGFIQNVIDYRRMILNPTYGNFGMLILPVAFYCMAGTAILIGYGIYNVVKNLSLQYTKFQSVGFQFHWNFNLPYISSDWWYYNFEASFLLGLLSMCIIIFAVWYGKRMTGIVDKRLVDILFFLILYSLISPFWLITSIYNTVRHRDAAWR